MADIDKGLNPENFSWVPPTSNVDGSPISGPLSYRVYRGDSDDMLAARPISFYIVVGALQEDGTYVAPLSEFPPGKHVIALTAIDAEGDESAFSNTMAFSISDKVPPRPPVITA